MRLIDADALENILENAISIQEEVSKTLGIEDDEGVQMELKAYRDILNGVKEQPTIEQTQDAKLLTEADFENNPLVDENGNLPVWCEHRSLNGIAHDPDGWTTINQYWVCGFNMKRYWSAKPTDDQRKEAPWKGDVW